MLRFDTIIGDIPYLLLGIPLTLALTVVAFAAAVVIGLPVAFVRNARIPILGFVARIVVDFFRTTPPLMHIVWAYYALPVLANIRLDAFTVVSGALACSAGAQMSEIFRGAITAVPRVLKRTGLTLDEIDLIELNEAFASQAVAVIRGVGFDEAKVNVNGGAIALGHPLGCTGAKLTVQLMHEMQRRDVQFGMVTMCVGGGMGAAGIFERLN